MPKFYIILIILALFNACANQTAPTGGPKDETAPILLNSTPEQGQLHYDGQTVELTFDEFIRTENPKEQFIITPRIEGEYEIKYRKEKVIIEFEDPLQDSTTYSINFREGIKDITEGNPADTLRLAFSTGAYLDSLSITGKITHLLTNKPLEDITVSLYRAHDTLNVLNSPPLYLTKTTPDGNYSLRNIKTGEYRIYALADKNKNMMLDSKTEAHGFEASIIALDSNISNLNIPIQLLDIREFEFQSARQSGTTYDVKYNKYVTRYKLSPRDTTLNIYSNFTDQSHNTIQIFEPENLIDSTAVILVATDSINMVLQDTIMLKFEETQRSPAEFTTRTKIERIVIDNPVFEATLSFSKPIKYINDDSLFVYLDSANIIHFTAEELLWNTRHDEVTLTAPIDPKLFITPEPTTAPRPGTEPLPAETEADKTPITQETDTIPDEPEEEAPPPPEPHFYAAPNTFITVEQDSSESIQQNLIFQRPSQLAVIIVHVQTEAEHYIVQLLNQSNEAVAERINTDRFKFQNVEPGDYRIRVLIDSNQNGHWDPGNLNLNIEPEPVIFYSGTEGDEVIETRENWELGPHVITF